MIFVIAADYCWVDCGSNELGKTIVKNLCVFACKIVVESCIFLQLCVDFVIDYNTTKAITTRDLVFHLSNVFSQVGFSFLNFNLYTVNVPVPVTARSKAYVFGRSPAEIVGSNPTGGGAWIFVCCECCVLSGRGLCDELITRPEESYRLWRVVLCDQETSNRRGLKPAAGL
jgi:hypothetical protein